MAEGQISIVVPVYAKDETKEAVRLELLALAEQTRKEEGNICYILHEAIDDKNLFIIYETWKNQDALDFHMEQKYLRGFLDKQSALLKQPISGTICQEFKE